MWRDVIAVNDYIKNGSGILPGRQAGDTATPEETAEYRYGNALDAHLAERQLVLDANDRPALIVAVSKAMDEAAQVNLRRAEGDYGPDEGEHRYPAFAPPSQAQRPTSTAAGLSRGPLTMKSNAAKKAGMPNHYAQILSQSIDG